MKAFSAAIVSGGVGGSTEMSDAIDKAVVRHSFRYKFTVVRDEGGEMTVGQVLDSLVPPLENRGSFIFILKG